MEKAHNVMDDHSAFRQLRLCHTEGVVQMGILPIVPYLERRMDFIAIQQIIANSRRNGTSLHSPAE